MNKLILIFIFTFSISHTLQAQDKKTLLDTITQTSNSEFTIISKVNHQLKSNEKNNVDNRYIDSSITETRSTTGPKPNIGISRGIIKNYTENGALIQNVPSYLWKNGCGPTAAGMVIGYWDVKGFSDLVEGDASTQTSQVNNMISSNENYDDYCEPIDHYPNLLPDLSEPPTGDEHNDNCIADFMKTSQSYYTNYYGWSRSSHVDDALIGYVQMVTPHLSVSVDFFSMHSGTFTWKMFRNEIDSNRPLMFLVDTDADGKTDHFITAIGYDEVDSTRMYGCYDTWDKNIHWYEFLKMVNGQPWGVSTAWLFNLSNPSNDPPIAADDNAYTYEDTPVTIDVLDNDIDLNDDTLSVSNITQGNHGLVTNNDSTVRYTPNLNYFGTDSFSYVVSDGYGGLDKAMVSVIITSVNDPPEITEIPDVSFPEDSLFKLDLDICAIDVDNENSELYWNSHVIDAALIGNSFAFITEFAIDHHTQLLIDPSDLKIEIDPNTHIATITATGDTSGIFLVEFGVADPGGLSDYDTITVTIWPKGDRPYVKQPVPDQNFSEDTGPHIVVSDLYEVFADPDPHALLNFSASSNNQNITFTIEDGSLSVNSAGNFFGAGMIIISVKDETGLSVSDSFLVNILPVNDIPVITSSPKTQAIEDQEYFYQVTATDVDNDTLIFRLNDSPSWLTINDSTGLISGLPKNNNVGDTTVIVQVDDKHGEIITQTYNLSVLNINDPPTFINLPDTIRFLNTDSYEFDFTDHIMDVDSPLENIIVTVSVDKDSIITLFDKETGVLTLTAPGYQGSGKLYCRVTDDSSASTVDTIIIQVTAYSSDIEDLQEIIPDQYVLEQNYPNPFNPSTIIKFGIPKSANVRIEIYNVLGEKVGELLNQQMPAGYHNVEFDASNIASGIYIYRLEAGEFVGTRKMILMR